MTVPPRGQSARPGSTPLLARRGKALAVVAVVFLVVFQVVPRALSLFVDWRWFDVLGASSVLRTQILTRLGLFLVVGLLVGAAVFAALQLAHRYRPVYLPPAGAPDVLARYRSALSAGPRSAMLWGPALLGVLAGTVAQSQWKVPLAFLNSTPFGRTDPQFGIDISFYAFALPFWRLALNWLLVAVVLAFVASLVANYVYGGICPGAREGSLSRAARVQLVVLAGLFVLVKAAAYWFDRYELLSKPGSTFTGAGYTDIHSVLPAKIFMFAVALVCAIAFFSAVVIRDLRIPALATVLLVFSAVVVGSIWPLAVEQFSVKPNRAAKESEYIARNIDATRAAFGIGDDSVQYVRDWGNATPRPADASKDEATLSNIRLLDPTVLEKTFTQQQQLRNFYGFPRELSLDRYEVDGQLRDFVVAARELNPDGLQANQRDWINKHTVYTHGNGFVAARADRVNEIATDAGSDRGGFPVYQVSDLQSKRAGEKTSIPVEQPRIYFGPLIARSDPDYAIVGGGDGPREYDTDTDKYTYTGSGGVPVSDWMSRIAFAVEFRERNILLSSLLGEDSKILFDRDPAERVRKVAPWLTTDSTVYPAVVDGRITWIVDGYTTLDSYPYSELAGLGPNASGPRLGAMGDDRVSYARNSVKATVDAYDGSVTLYANDETDPVLQTWSKAFPGTVKPGSEMSRSLREHLRYPKDLFTAQRDLLARYHVDDPNQFFTNDAFWSVPGDPTAKSVAGPVSTSTSGTGQSGAQSQAAQAAASAPAQPANYVLASDPKTGRPSFQIMSAYAGYQREFLSAHMTASSDPESYGRITVRVQRPTEPQAQGPNQAQDLMLSSSGVAQDRRLLESLSITEGNQLALPLGEDSMLYVEPIYAQRKDQDSAFPKLLRVMVSYNRQVGYAPTLCKALGQVGITVDPNAVKTAENSSSAADCGAAPATSTPVQQTPAVGAQGPAPSRDGAVRSLDDALGRVREAQRSGDLATLGTALEALQKAVDGYRSSAPGGGN